MSSREEQALLPTWVAEKFFDIKCRKAGLSPTLTVIAATTGGLKMHGDVQKNFKTERRSFEKGLANLDKHIENMKKFGQTVIVALNKYGYDTDEELAIVREHYRKTEPLAFTVNSAFVKRRQRCEALAKLVVEKIDKEPSKPLKLSTMKMTASKQRLKKSAEIYSAASVTYGKPLTEKDIPRNCRQLKLQSIQFVSQKTRYSFSSDRNARCSDRFEMHVREVVLNNGSEIVVPIMGDMMRMPGFMKNRRQFILTL